MATAGQKYTVTSEPVFTINGGPFPLADAFTVALGLKRLIAVGEIVTQEADESDEDGDLLVRCDSDGNLEALSPSCLTAV